MKRDMDLCREIMRQMADTRSLNERPKVHVEVKSDDEITYQLHIMRQAELIEAIDLTTKAGMAYMPQRLTWKGNEFLAAAHDDTVWNRAKARFLKAGGAL